VKLGAMIEIPAAALTLRTFLKYFDFLSIGTNDLIQYTLAIDRADESVAHLYDPLPSGRAAAGGRHHRRMPRRARASASAARWPAT
jgi:signal transduction protein with GAF and PtsI domain